MHSDEKYYMHFPNTMYHFKITTLFGCNGDGAHPPIQSRKLSLRQYKLKRYSHAVYPWAQGDTMISHVDTTGSDPEFEVNSKILRPVNLR